VVFDIQVYKTLPPWGLGAMHIKPINVGLYTYLSTICFSLSIYIPNKTKNINKKPYAEVEDILDSSLAVYQ
jgi:hypothetical protein